MMPVDKPKDAQRVAFEKAMAGRALLVRSVPGPTIAMLYAEHRETWDAALATQAPLVAAARWAREVMKDVPLSIPTREYYLRCSMTITALDAALKEIKP